MPGAGDLKERLHFQKRLDATDDGYGNTEGGWQTQFTCNANVLPLRGSEPVIAQRLAGVQPVIITIRSCEDARLAQPHWRAVDTRRPTVIYNLKAGANFDMLNEFVVFMAETGVPT